MTEIMLDGVGLGPEDRVVEFLPGFGETARRIARERPRSYTGVCPTSREARALAAGLRRDPDLLTLVTRAEKSGHYAGVVAGAPDACGLDDSSANVVIGEFLLTPLVTRDKAAVVAEAARLLPVGGRLGLHEIAIAPDTTWGDAASEASRVGDLSRELADARRGAIHPLTEAGWRQVLEEAGLVVLGARPGSLVAPRLVDVVTAVGMRRLPTFALAALRGLGSLREVQGLGYAMAAYPELGALALVAEKPLLGDVRLPSA